MPTYSASMFNEECEYGLEFADNGGKTITARGALLHKPEQRFIHAAGNVG